MKLTSKRCFNANQVRRYLATHEVFNQSKPLLDYNLFRSNKIMNKIFEKTSHLDALLNVGKICGSSEYMNYADLAEKNKPVLRQFDNYGRRIDVIDYHPTYHLLMKSSIELGGAAFGFKHHDHKSRASIIFMLNQLEPGHCCPVVMTSAAIPVLRQFDYTSSWLNKILSCQYDSNDIPLFEKKGVVIGMSMTEKQGGSDVRSNTTMAIPINPLKQGGGEDYLITGHKWFTSAPMSDGFLTLAKTKDSKNNELGLSCFLVARWNKDGSRNSGFNVMRLKEKLGDRANASSEVEYNNAHGMLIGEVNKGVKTIIEMVQSTRLDCILGSAGGMRKALDFAINHVSHRNAFGSVLINQPLMENLLTDLCLESEAHMLTGFSLADLFNNSENHDEEAKQLFRLLVPICKYYVTKRTPNFTYECMEILGGNGYVEDFPLAKLFRQSPLNSIWEGSGNVIALDVLKAFQSLPLFFKILKNSNTKNVIFEKYIADLEKSISHLNPEEMTRSARFIVDRLAIAYQCFLMINQSTEISSNAFINSRLGNFGNNKFGLNYGSTYIFSKIESNHIIERHSLHFNT